jgi:hypothetical protein
MLCSQKYTTLKCTADVSFSICTTICVGLRHNIERCSLMSSDSGSHAYDTFRSSSLYTDHHHISCRNTATLRHCLCFPLEDQCFECFTSNRLSWDAIALGLPLEMPLTVTFSSCKWMINLWIRTSWKFLWVILPPHDLRVRNLLSMVMSERWKNRFLRPLLCSLGSSVALHRSGWLVHKPHVGIAVF